LLHNLFSLFFKKIVLKTLNIVGFFKRKQKGRDEIFSEV